MGAIFSTVVIAGAAERLPFGIVRLLGGLAFCLGLVLVVVAGAETGGEDEPPQSCRSDGERELEGRPGHAGRITGCVGSS